MAKNPAPASPRKLTDAQRAYETKRAEKAGMSLDKWLAQKDKQALAEAPKPVAPPKPPGFWTRLLDRAHQPIKKS